MNGNGWIKLHRKFLEWEWYDDINTKVLFIHLLLKANYKDKKWRGVDIKRGQLLTGLNSLKEETNLSVQQLRTSISKLEKTGEINKQSNKQYSIITVCNYDSYNKKEDESTNKATHDQQSTNKEATNDQQQHKKERKEEGKNINIPFERFWNLYDKKKGSKYKCEKKWNNLTTKDREAIINMLPIWKQQFKDKQYQPYPYTFLNGRVWESEDELKQNEKSKWISEEERSKIINGITQKSTKNE